LNLNKINVMDYQEFLQRKRHSIGDFGFKCQWLPEIGFDFQKFIIEKNIRKGRIANFLDTGLGKTLIQISTAYNIVLHTNKKVLILTPLAVAFQFIKQASEIGIDDIEYSKDGKHAKKIVICNYERLHYFDSNDFEAVLLDESSILKNFDGKIKGQITFDKEKSRPVAYVTIKLPSRNFQKKVQQVNAISEKKLTRFIRANKFTAKDGTKTYRPPRAVAIILKTKTPGKKGYFYVSKMSEPDFVVNESNVKKEAARRLSEYNNTMLDKVEQYDEPVKLYNVKEVSIRFLY